MAKWGEIKCPRCEEMEAKLTDPANAIWAEFKDRWEGEKKFALRQIIRWLKNTPGGEAEGECPPRADGSSEDG